MSAEYLFESCCQHEVLSKTSLYTDAACCSACSAQQNGQLPLASSLKLPCTAANVVRHNELPVHSKGYRCAVGHAGPTAEWLAMDI